MLKFLALGAATLTLSGCAVYPAPAPGPAIVYQQPYYYAPAPAIYTAPVYYGAPSYYAEPVYAGPAVGLNFDFHGRRRWR